MASRADEIFGRVVLQKGLLTVGQLQACRHEQARLERSGQTLALGEIAVKKGLISQQQLTQLAAESKPKSSGKTIGNYRIISMLGKGGMGAVYKARHIHLDKTVALKVLPPKLARNRMYVERFQREARLAAKISHPNVVQVFDVGEESGLHYLCMEFVDGETVGDMIKRDGKINETRAIKIVLEVARALEEVDEYGIIHRDIKPENIMLTRKGLAKLGDLGIARQTQSQDATLTSAGAAMGTPSYMAPEQARGAHEVDARADIYSLGASLFHMVTGKLPFQGKSANEIIIKLASQPVPDPRTIAPDLSDNVAELILRMMAKDPNERHQNAATLVAELEALVAGDSQAVLEPPPDQDLVTIASVSPFPAEPVAPPKEAAAPEETSPTPPPEPGAPKRRKKSPLLVVVVILILAGIAAAYFALRPRAPEPTSPPAPARETADQEAQPEPGKKQPPATAPDQALRRSINQARSAKNQADNAANYADKKRHLENAAPLYQRALELARAEGGDLTALQSELDRVNTELQAVSRDLKKQTELHREQERKQRKYDQARKRAIEATRAEQWAEALNAWAEAKQAAADLDPRPEGYDKIEAQISRIRGEQQGTQRAKGYTEALNKARHAAKEGRLQHALQLYQGAAKIAPNPADLDLEIAAVKNRINALRLQGERQADYHRFYNHARALMQQEKWSDARGALERASQIAQGLDKKPTTLKGIPALLGAVRQAEAKGKQGAERKRQFSLLVEKAGRAEKKGDLAAAIRLLNDSRACAQPENRAGIERRIRGLNAKLREAGARESKLAAYRDVVKTASGLTGQGKWVDALAAWKKAEVVGADLRPPPADYLAITSHINRCERSAAYEQVVKLAEQAEAAQDWQAAEAAWERARTAGTGLKPPPKGHADIAARIVACKSAANPPEGMAFVPGGFFQMGADSGSEDERPAHKVYVSPFFIERHEVTNSQYRRFVLDTGHTPPKNEADRYTLWGGYFKKESYVNAAISNQPVVNVSWHDAVAYCDWRSQKEGLPKGTYRLPTEAEWEKAARGPDSRIYPWGNDPPTPARARFGMTWNGKRSMISVTALPEGKSPYGCCHMAGNAEEWCADWYLGEYYLSAPDRDPKGPRTGLVRVIRGGGWQSSATQIRTSSRIRRDYPTSRSPSVGFRCARSP